MTTLKIQGLEVKIKKQLSNYQLFLLNSVSDSYKLGYLRSFLGHRNSMPDVYRKRNAFRSNRDEIFNRKPNTFFKMAMAKYDAESSKKPDNTSIGEWIGVEIECMIPNFRDIDHDCYCEYDGDELTDECSCCRNDCDCSGNNLELLRDKFQNARIKNITVKDDGSIREESGYFSAEICVLYKRSDDSNLKATCNLLNKLGAKVNKSCGLHVHLDARDCTESQVRRRGKRLGNALPVLTKMVPKSRLDNSYCRLVVSAINGNRYSAINLTAYKRFKTIEVRLHSSTTDFEKISQWVEILYSISRCSKMSREKTESIDDMVQKTKLNNQLTSFIKARASKFNQIDSEEDSTVTVDQHGNTEILYSPVNSSVIF